MDNDQCPLSGNLMIVQFPGSSDEVYVTIQAVASMITNLMFVCVIFSVYT
jgi:hypothetical protein